MDRIGMSDTSAAYMALVEELTEKMELGDEFAARVVGAMALLIGGWRFGDPDEPDDDPDPGEPVPGDVVLRDILLRRAA